MTKYIFILVLLLGACKSSNKIVLYKDKETMDKGFFTNSIKDFPWTNKSDNVIDSLVLKGKKAKEINSMITNLEKVSSNNVSMGKPRYAFILEYNSKKDTLYFYDFNDENYKNEAYLVKNNITLKDTNDVLKKYLFKHNEKFIRKEYYQVPGSKKETYYFKE